MNKFFVLVALLLSASTINQEEAAKLMEEVAQEVKAEETAHPINNVKKPPSTKSTMVLPKKSNSSYSATGAATNSKVTSKTVMKKTVSTSVPARPTIAGRSPLASRRNPTQVHSTPSSICYKF